MKSYFGKYIPLLFFAAVSLVVANAFIFFSKLTNMIDDQQWVNHSHIIISQVEAALSTLKEAESAQRGFLLTNDAAYVGQFNRVISPLDSDMKQLINNIHGNRSQ